MIGWFTGKRRNRRFVESGLERGHLLGVRLRSKQTRAQRWRGFGLCVAVVVSAVVLWRGGQWLLDVLIYRNEAFAIRHIEVATDGVLTGEVIRSWAGVRPGQNLMALDLARVQRNLEAQPPIQFAAVERVLPSTLKLDVTEREPVAQTVFTVPRRSGGVEQDVYQFDENGYAMQPLDPRWRTSPPEPGERLPVLLNVAPGDTPPGRPTESPQVRAALQLICDLDHSPMAGMVEFNTIDLSVPETLQVTTSQGAQIIFSLNQFDRQFRRWRLIYDQYQRWGRAITWLDLSIDNNLPVRSVAYSGAPPAPQFQPGKPQRTRKKHV